MEALGYVVEDRQMEDGTGYSVAIKNNVEIHIHTLMKLKPINPQDFIDKLKSGKAGGD